MNLIKYHHKTLFAFLLPSLLILAGCSDDDDSDDPMSSYTITITNITNNQPLTPAAVILHKSGYEAWEVGTAATTGLEMLAESGNPADFITEAMANTNVIMTRMASSAPVGPGSSASITMTLSPDSDVLLTVATMLANTNDAFAGNVGVPIGAMSVGDTMTIYSHAHDAGTEANTEAAGMMPGPADGGEGFNMIRDDIHDFVTIHPGVVSVDDGLGDSALDETHRWLDVVAKISITRN